jgi:hypothetical protein
MYLFSRIAMTANCLEIFSLLILSTWVTLLILKTNSLEVELAVTENAMHILVHTLSKLNLNFDSGELVLIRLISDLSCSYAVLAAWRSGCR